MKLLAIGDFHGKFPKKLEKRIKKEKPDLIISIGDYFPFSLRKTFFKYCYGKPIEIWEVVGRQRFKKSFLKDLKTGGGIMQRLDNLKIPIFSVVGNYDLDTPLDSYDLKHMKSQTGKKWRWLEKDFFPMIINKFENIKRIDYKSFKFKKLVLIGAYGSMIPGKVKSRHFKMYRKKLDKLFLKFKKENKQKKVIFVFHNMPYNCKLDVIRAKEAPASERGKHYGSKLVRRAIDSHQPVLGLGGHFHENQGKCKIGRTLVVNPGAAYEGKAAFIEFDEKKGKVERVRFVK